MPNIMKPDSFDSGFFLNGLQVGFGKFLLPSETLLYQVVACNTALCAFLRVCKEKQDIYLSYGLSRLRGGYYLLTANNSICLVYVYDTVF